MDREKRLFTGQMIEGDFEENTMKFKIDGEMILQAGNYTIMLTDDFKKLSEPTTEDDTSEKANELISDVSQQRELFYNFITWYNAKPFVKKPKDGLITTTIIEEYLKL